MTLDSLDGKVALITGASSGIGSETAKALADEGANIVLASRSRGELDNLADIIEEEYGVDVIVVPTDVTESEQVNELIKETISRFDRLDIVVNNAGLARGSNVEDLSDEQFDNMMDVNCDGMFYIARAALPHLEESEGNLIFLGSIAGQYPRPGNPVYAATKWWTHGLALSLSAAHGDEDVAVTVINPSEVRTQFASQDSEAFEQQFEEGEVTEPEDIAETIVFAAKQDTPNTLNEIDVYRQDKLGDIIS